MNPNEKYEQQSTQLDSSGKTRETITRTVEGQKQLGLAPSTIAVIVILAVLGAGAVYYFVSNNNENQEANRQAALEGNRIQAEAAKRQTPAPTQPPPVIIQQPVPAQQAPVIIQQPSLAPSTEAKNMVDDSTIQDAATKRLSDNLEMDSVTVTVLNGKALISGNVTSAVSKTKAEQIVRAVRGVKSVENKVTVASS